MRLVFRLPQPERDMRWLHGFPIPSLPPVYLVFRKVLPLPYWPGLPKTSPLAV